MNIKKIIAVLFIVFSLGSCFPSGDVHREEGKIFHACIPNSGAVGGLYFGLYNDQQYQICSTGGVGQNCYTGKYVLNNDTLTLLGLSSAIHLKSNKLLIKPYSQPINSDLGEVVQLDEKNHPLQGKMNTYFVVRMDSLPTTANKGLVK